ncbi:MAG: HupE/UreJ family protein [Rhizobiales bacterium]|nr:HupE/UreJ family protein [Hyphomicrobiales bacterium]OJY42928.1 MAG: hypothetical protein BGP08_19680 [Rhizobiales bacterium 64-17]
MKKVAATGFLVVMSSASPALAHVGAGDVHSFASGMLHPLSGLDHMLAAFAVGLWAALSDARRPLVWPITFVVVMALATVLGAGGVPLPFVEPAIAGSVLALGLLIALSVHAGTWVGAALIALFAVVHGHAHGAEGGASLSYLSGLVVATAVLHAAGLASGRAAQLLNATLAARAVGGLIAAAGVWLLAAG